MRRRGVGMAAALLLLAPLALSLSGCSSGNGQLRVSISGDSNNYKGGNAATYAHYRPGDQASFTIAVVNAGPGSVSGVTVHVVLPQGFKYRATESIDAPGATRTQPLDAAVNSGAPIFGLWTLAPPGAAGKGIDTEVDISFSVDVVGAPGPALVQAFAAGDEAVGQTNAAPYIVVVDAAAHLNALVNVTPTNAKAGSTVTYEVRLTNSGTGSAGDVAVLVTLPPVLTFSSSVLPFAGNGARNKGTDPIRNTLEVYYDGFLLPPLSNAGPGFVVIVFRAVVGMMSPAGTYPVDANVTDDAGDTVTLHAVAALTVG